MSEVYEALGFEKPPLDHPAHHAFWDKNGFHESDSDGEIVSNLDTKIVSNDDIYTAIKQACNELGSGKLQPSRLFNILAQHNYINIYDKKTNVSNWVKISDEELLNIRGFGPRSIKHFRRTIDILYGANPLSKKVYTITLSFEELSSLRHICKRKKTEIDLLKRIINNAISTND